MQQDFPFLFVSDGVSRPFFGGDHTVDGECKVLLSLPELQMHLKRRWRGSRKTSAQMAQEHLHGTMGRVSCTASARPTPPPHPALPSL